MSESSATPSAQVVAREFVKQYYTMLNNAPHFLHRFYSHNSSFIHADDVTAVTGQAEIHKKIMLLNFNNCHARICQVDSQSSVGDTIAIQVIGELSNAGQPMQRFVQSFVLAPQSANKYYVHVDIFRYQDSIPTDGIDEQEAAENGEAIEPFPASSNEGISMTIEGDSSEPSVDTISQQQQHQEQSQANNSGVDANVVAGTNGSVEGGSNEDFREAAETTGNASEKDHVSTREGPAAVPGVVTSEPVKPAEVIAEPVPVEQTAPPKPLSWAAMASRKTPGSTPQQSGAAVNNASARPPVSAVAQKSTDAVSVSPRTNRPVATSSDDRGVNGNGKQMTNGSKDSTDGGRRGNVAPLTNVSDNQQIFIGNLPQHVTDQDLIEFFEKFGAVLDFKISRKAGTSSANNNVGQKNFGFMAFESSHTVQKVLDARPIHMGKIRLNIEEKKAKEELARVRSAGPSQGGSSKPQSESGYAPARSTNGVQRGSGREFRADTRTNATDGN